MNYAHYAHSPYEISWKHGIEENACPFKENAGYIYVFVSQEFCVGWNIHFGFGLHAWTNMYCYIYNFEIIYSDRCWINDSLSEILWLWTVVVYEHT